MTERIIAHPRSEISMSLSHHDLEIIHLALRVLLQESTREEHIFGAIREALGKVDSALSRQQEPEKAA